MKHYVPAPPKVYCESCGRPLKFAKPYISSYHSLTGEPEVYKVEARCPTFFGRFNHYYKKCFRHDLGTDYWTDKQGKKYPIDKLESFVVTGERK